MCGGDGFARVRQITEAQQQVADRLAHQRGLSLLPSDGQTYRPCQDRGLIAQVAGRGRAFEGFTGAEINSLACTRLSILWEKMGAWSWSTPPTNILSKRESQAALRLNLYGQWSLQLCQVPGQIQSMLYLSAMQCLVSQSLSSPATQAKLRSQSQASLLCIIPPKPSSNRSKKKKASLLHRS